MDVGNAGRAVALANQIATIQQVLAMIDAGGKITSMTLTRPEPEAPPPIQPLAATDEEEGPEEAEEPTPTPGEPEDSLPITPDDAPVSPGAITVITEGMTYPPQMLQAIRAQEVQMWQAAYDELAQLGATNVPSPSAPAPQVVPTRAATVAAATAATAAARAARLPPTRAPQPPARPAAPPRAAPAPPRPAPPPARPARPTPPPAPTPTRTPTRPPPRQPRR